MSIVHGDFRLDNLVFDNNVRCNDKPSELIDLRCCFFWAPGCCVAGSRRNLR